jgi:hypothetical protein
MAQVRKATIDLFDRIYPLLATFGVRGMGRDEWYNLLSSRWFAGHDHFGYVLIENGEVVGFLGVFYHRCTVDGIEREIGSFFCWYVVEEHRRLSLLLLRPLLTRKELTVTSLTPSREATLIWDRFQFQVLEETVLILPLRPVVPFGPRCELIDDPDRILELLNREDARILNDHRFPTCSHLLVRDPAANRSCYIIHNRVRKKGVFFTQLCHVSDPALAAAFFSRLSWFFFRKNRTLCTIVDRRLLQGHVPWPAYGYRLRYARRFRSEHLTASRIDNLYTELPLLQMV